MSDAGMERIESVVRQVTAVDETGVWKRSRWIGIDVSILVISVQPLLILPIRPTKSAKICLQACLLSEESAGIHCSCPLSTEFPNLRPTSQLTNQNGIRQSVGYL